MSRRDDATSDDAREDRRGDRAAADAPLIDPAMLDALLRAQEPLPPAALAPALAGSPRRLAAEVERLRRAGCVLESHPQRGLRLLRSSLETWADYLRWRDQALGRPARLIQVFRATASTQDVARRLVESSGLAGQGAVVLADEQTAGRGRLGRVWTAPPGSSVLLTRACLAHGRPGDAAPAALGVDRLMFASAVAVARALEAAAAPRSLSVRIKWPNDLLVDGRKIAGILVETFQLPGPPPAQPLFAALIGIGVNVSVTPGDLPPDDHALRLRVGSLAMLGLSVDRLRVAAELVEALDHALIDERPEAIALEWRRRSTLIAQRLRLRSDGRIVEGHVVDLDPYEGLIIRTDRGELLHLHAATTAVL